MTGTVHFYVDISDADKELARLEDEPSLATIAGFEGVLAASFGATQMAVHIITGSLRGSGKIGSDYQNDTWSGEISYGGVSAGFVNDPVKYAWYEMRRGWDHDFLAPARDLHHRYGEIISDVLRGER